MPVYEYLCDEGHEFEEEQRITEDPLTTCVWVRDEGGPIDPLATMCGAPCRRQLSKSSFSLKGGGWSGDGYAKKGN